MSTQTHASHGPRSVIRACLTACALGLLVPVAACDSIEEFDDDELTGDGVQLRAWSEGNAPGGALAALATTGMTQSSCAEEKPRYASSEVIDEIVGVQHSNPKSIYFETLGGEFSVDLHNYPNKRMAKVTLIDMDQPNTTKICTNPGNNCVANVGQNAVAFGPNIEMKVERTQNDTKTAYARYSTQYTKKCDPLAGRYCGQECQFDDATMTFGQNGHVETLNGSYQGNVRLFPVAGGDLAKVKFRSTKQMNTTPTLRVRATKNGVEDRLGSKYACQFTGTLNNKYYYECSIPFDDAVSSTSGYTDPHLILASARTQAGATLEFWETSRTSIADYTCSGS